MQRSFDVVFLFFGVNIDVILIDDVPPPGVVRVTAW